jgi:chemotaxis signal transduction protein
MNNIPFDYLLFSTRNRYYAIPAADVYYIVQSVAVTPIPDSPVYVIGSFNFHGRIIYLIDIDSIIKKERASSITTNDYFIVMRYNERLLAVIANKIFDIVPLSLDCSQGQNNFVNGIQCWESCEFIGNEPLNIVNVENFFNLDELSEMSNLIIQSDSN